MKPIIMITEEVHGILDGRKMMARMPIKPQPYYFYNSLYEEQKPLKGDRLGAVMPDNTDAWIKSPYRIGDVLYVRESSRPITATVTHWSSGETVDEPEYHCGYQYLSDSAMYFPDGFTACDDEFTLTDIKYGVAKSPVSMPRSAARLFLRVTDVRAERVQDIAEKDAIREGIMYTDYGMNSDMGKLSVDGGKTFHELKPLHYPGYHAGRATNPDQCFCTARRAFADLWDARNAKRGYGWDTNPYVWVIEFERISSSVIGPEPDETAPNSICTGFHHATLPEVKE